LWKAEAELSHLPERLHVLLIVHDGEPGSFQSGSIKEIHSMLRLMRDNYERGMHEGEEYQYWQKVSALKEKLDLLSRLPEPAIKRATRTLLDLRDSCEWATKEERRDLVRMMIQGVGLDVAAKQVVCVKPVPALMCFSSF